MPATAQNADQRTSAIGKQTAAQIFMSGDGSPTRFTGTRAGKQVKRDIDQEKL